MSNLSEPILFETPVTAIAKQTAVINLFGGRGPICLNFSSATQNTMFDLKQMIFSRLFIDPEDQVYYTSSGKQLTEDDRIFESEHAEFTTLNLKLRLFGGKGGFGSMLRAQGGKMASQKTTNFEACRDLNGRRLRTVNEAKRLADHLEQEPDRERVRREKVQKKIEEGLAELPTKRIRFDDTEYLKANEEMKEKVSSAVSEAVSKKSIVINNNGESSGSQNVLSLWDAVVLSEDDSSSTDSDDEIVEKEDIKGKGKEDETKKRKRKQRE
ncbi:5202_t:CDS:1 [Acaulospora morrowiae]|uniref:5202_t:CDS:1 n=1 Tax=Acaulospora morrowiae TaxID=94023 RepID=A0A9N9AEL7_9GLOM|nr:5202_t:CDS:1 [Acaulospora morrowiae]